METLNSQPDKETQEMLQSFVEETLDSLDKNEPLVEELSKEDNPESVNAIFRTFHTIKGLSGFFGLTVISGVTHKAETLLDIIRDENKSQSQKTVTIVYEAFDIIRKLVAHVNVNFNDLAYSDEVEFIKAKLENEIANHSQQDELSESGKGIIDLHSKAEFPNQNINIVPEEPMQNVISGELYQRFYSESNDLLNTVEKKILELENAEDKSRLVVDAFGKIHSIKGNAGFLGANIIEKLSAEIEGILGDWRTNPANISSSLITKIFDLIDQLRLEINLLNPKQTYTDITKETTKNEIIAPTISASSTEFENNSTLNKTKILEQNNPEKSQPKIEKKEPKIATVNKDNQPLSIQKKEIRVDTNKLDNLFDLVGELITIEAMVTHCPELQGMDLPVFQKSAAMLNKITRELQEVTMSMRMTPLEGLFNKTKRLVRDLSIKANKKVELKITGEDTEMDKNVIEELSDPLVHLIRNSMDHGIETANERFRKGKSDTGLIKLMAAYEGNEIIIVIEDDGAGLNKSKILKKAESQGLIKNSAEKMSDKEIWHLIFEPGFSTAEKVTDISGRGVGMDVVKRNIEKLRGSVDIESKTDVGTKIILRIPLTLAIMESMLIKVGDTKYAIPILSIRETFQPKVEDITITMDNLEVVKVRNELFPIIRLHEFLNKKSLYTELEEGILIIIETRTGKACIFVDEILGQQQTVIKGMSDYIGKIQGITGCMILGNGEVGLILDVDMILALAKTKI